MRDWDFVRMMMPDLEEEGPTIELVRDARGVWRAPGDAWDGYARNRQGSRKATADPSSTGQRLGAGLKQPVGKDTLQAALRFFKGWVRDWKVMGPRSTQQPA
jgi:hypothetical protein